jgi:hypothetical protein
MYNDVEKKNEKKREKKKMNDQCQTAGKRGHHCINLLLWMLGVAHE